MVVSLEIQEVVQDNQSDSEWKSRTVQLIKPLKVSSFDANIAGMNMN